jgi:putative transposase
VWGRSSGYLKAIRFRFPWLRHVFADGGYAGHKLRNALAGNNAT